MVAFAFQIYCDFSGYSLIARGLAKTMGYHFKMNFNHPYLSSSLKEFWGRWHISCQHGSEITFIFHWGELERNVFWIVIFMGNDVAIWFMAWCKHYVYCLGSRCMLYF